jgi:phenylpropionate dioxygenase-like ring-hydroxylating dioxygenase large terminal subunit
MFINNWYAACIGADLGDRPARVRMLGCDFVLFRDSQGVARALSDACCHRGASLGGGTCRGDVVICPQHGWEFDGHGQCRLIPAGTPEPKNPPKRARVPSYPVEEKYGLVFVFLGDLDEQHRPALPEILPEWGTPEWRGSILSRQKAVNYIRMCENYNDPCHVHYVHEFAKWLPKGVTIDTHELTDTRVKAFHAAWDAKGKWSNEVGLLMEYDVIGLISRNTNRQKNYPPQIVVAAVTPIDAGNTQIHMLILTPVAAITEAQHEQLVTMTRDVVMDEDFAVLKNTRPREAASPAEELLVETDLTVAQVRKMTVDYGRKWGEIDVIALKQVDDTQIRVIPCPGHRADPKNWVHRTVPLRAGGDPASVRLAANQD